tara:strand:+ start:121 stop:351 length:231 start_codon:yes stop_codon:yes gene_type:complete
MLFHPDWKEKSEPPPLFLVTALSGSISLAAHVRASLHAGGATPAKKKQMALPRSPVAAATARPVPKGKGGKKSKQQ